MARAFENGDVVRLRSGTRDMTVAEFDAGRTEYLCLWEGHPQKGQDYFKEDVLELVRRKGPKAPPVKMSN